MKKNAYFERNKFRNKFKSKKTKIKTSVHVEKSVITETHKKIIKQQQ